MLRGWGVKHILISKVLRAATTCVFPLKAFWPRCFSHFEFQMCFAPQRRALFQHLNFQGCSVSEVFFAFSIPLVLRPAMACVFSRAQRPKLVRAWDFLYILTSQRASRHKGVQFFISHLPRWLRTRRFSELTSRPSRATKHWKTQCFTTFPPFRAPWSSLFWLLTLSLLWSSFFFSSLTLPTSASSSVHTVGSLISNLPSAIVCMCILFIPWKKLLLPVLPRKAVAEVSKIGNL